MSTRSIIPACLPVVSLLAMSCQQGDSTADDTSPEPPPSVVIQTKFIEVSSGTEELPFGWILEPYDSDEDK